MDPPQRKKQNDSPDNLDIVPMNIDIDDDELEVPIEDFQHTKAPPQSDIGTKAPPQSDIGTKAPPQCDIGGAPTLPTAALDSIHTASESDQEAGDHANADPDFNLEKFGLKVKEGIRQLSPFPSPKFKQKEKSSHTPEKGVTSPEKGKDETDRKAATPPREVPDVPRYSCGYKKVGKALFFSCPKTMVGERKRCQEDLTGIRTKLSELGFETSKPVNDASQDQMETAIKDVCDSKYSDYGMLICVLLSNADHGLIYPQGAPRFSVTKLSEPLSHGQHPVWAGKPKIFILLTPFLEVRTQALGAGVKKEVDIPSEADFLYLWSFVPESYEERDELQRLLGQDCSDKTQLGKGLEELCHDKNKREKILNESVKLLRRRKNLMKMSLTAEHLVRELSEAGQRDLGDVFTRVINSVVSEVEGHQGATIKGGSMPTKRMIYMVSQLRKLLFLSKS